MSCQRPSDSRASQEIHRTASLPSAAASPSPLPPPPATPAAASEHTVLRRDPDPIASMVDPCKGPLQSHGCEDLAPDHAPPSLLYPPAPPTPPSSSSAASHGRSTFVTALIIASCVLAFLALCISVFLFVRRSRHRRRRRREALLEAALAAPPDDGGGGGPGEEGVHHAWHIRTVGLDEAAIESIALARYRSGAAAAADCTVCLAEFRDGELLRLLPKCAHAFHVQCIDTWLRAHVTCPLCRATVIDPAAAAEQPDPAPPGAEQEHDAGNNIGVPAPGHEQPGQHAHEHRVDQGEEPDISSDQPRQRPGPRPRGFRRVASMDWPSPSPVASAEEALPEHEQAGGKKQGTGDAVCCEVPPGSEHPNPAAMKRSLSAGSRWTLLSRPCRPRSSLLPL